MIKAGSKRKADEFESPPRNVRAKTGDVSTPVKPFTAKPPTAARPATGATSRTATTATTRTITNAAKTTKTTTAVKTTAAAKKPAATTAKPAAAPATKAPPPWDFKAKQAAQVARAEKMKENLKAKDAQNAELNSRISELVQKIAELDQASQRISQLEATIKSKDKKISSLEAEKHGLEQSLQESQAESAERQTRINELTCVVAERDAAIESLEHKRREEELLRRKLHNTILELKGNIRVFCRVRPLLSSEKAQVGDVQHFTFPENCDNMKLDAVGPPTTSVTGKVEPGKKYNYSFDKVFAPGTRQETVFEEISQLVQSALDGYKVCIFAYGSTGSGKTFTMEGSSVTHPENKGMIPRAVEQIFESSKTLIDQGWSYEFDVSFLEIYNERVRDLFHDKDEVDEKKYDIKMDPSTKTTEVTNLQKMTVSSPTEVYSLLKTAAANRSVAATKCNERSSRSHSVFILKITGKNEVTGQVTKGQLNLIDLAGSERLALSGATGKAKEETQHINTSLFTLSKVISALANKASHVPYRDSALTRLLQPCLGGDAKTLMFVNVSPLPEHFGESVNSLRFATQVNACEVGTAKRKVGAASSSQ